MIGTLHSVILDTADARGLAAFYRELGGWTTHSESDTWVSLLTGEGHKVEFQLVPDHVPPRWPDPKHPQQMHLDLLVPDREAAVERAVRIGATRLPGGGDTWTVLADPSGHPFCLCSGEADRATSGAGPEGRGVEATLADVGIDVPDGKAIAPFYAALLGLGVTYEGDEGAAIGAEGALTIMFQNVEEYHAPRWPDPAFPQQFHLDVAVEDIEVAQPQVLELGATLLQGGGGKRSGFRVYADPVGHPFCLVWGQ